MEGIAKLLFLMALGGLIAFLGDRIGKYIGKRKLTVFNLRPRITSQIFTVVFGMIISLTTLTIMAGVFPEVRQSLFNVHQLEQDLRRLSKVTTTGELVFHINQPIVMGSIDGASPRAEVGQSLSDLLLRADEVARARSGEAAKLQGLPSPAARDLVVPQKAEWDRAALFLSRNSGKFAVLIYAVRNTYFGEKVIAGLDLRPNKKIYGAGQSITSMTLSSNESDDQILLDLFDLLSKLQQTALNAGMLPNPVTNNFGGNILVAALFNKRDEVKAIKGKARVEVIANKNLYTVGPLDVRFDVRPAAE